jgi:hypothetical protein
VTPWKTLERDASYFWVKSAQKLTG